MSSSVLISTGPYIPSGGGAKELVAEESRQLNSYSIEKALFVTTLQLGLDPMTTDYNSFVSTLPVAFKGMSRNLTDEMLHLWAKLSS